MWSEETTRMTREMLESRDFVPIMALSRTQGRMPFGMAVKHRPAEGPAAHGYVLATEMNDHSIVVRDFNDESVIVTFDSVTALIDAGWAVD